MAKVRKRIKNWLIYQLTRYGFRFLQGIKRETALRFLGTLGRMGFYLVPSERKKTIRHLTWVYGKRHDDRRIRLMAREVFSNLGKNMVDAFRIAKLNPGNIDSLVTVRGIEKLDKALAKGKGVIALTGHIGNWELLGAYFAIKGYPLNVVGAPIYDSRLDEMVAQNRLRSGIKYIHRDGAFRDIIRALTMNEIVGILIDQDTRHVSGAFVDFLGRDAYTPVGPVILAMKTGASFVPLAIHLARDNTHVIEVGDEFQLTLTGEDERDVTANTLRCSKVVEAFILRYPTQWVWMHERWKTKKKVKG